MLFLLISALVVFSSGCITLYGNDYGGDHPWRHTDGSVWGGPEDSQCK